MCRFDTVLHKLLCYIDLDRANYFCKKILTKCSLGRGLENSQSQKQMTAEKFVDWFDKSDAFGHIIGMDKIIFNVNHAHKHMTDLTKAQALKWVLIANTEALRRLNLGARDREARNFAVKKANTALQGKKEERI